MEISEFSRTDREVVFETKNGKVRLSFDEWKHIVDAYRDLKVKEG